MIQIDRRISLEFLGEKYKDSFLEFKAIATKDYEGLQTKVKAVEKDVNQAVPLIIDELSTRFVSGKVDGVDVTKEDLGDLPLDVLLECFTTLRGKLDPKG